MEEVIYDKSKMKVPVKIWATNLEDAAREEAIRAANLPCIFSHLSIMADGHYCPGGVPVGCVLATQRAIVPGAAGSDIGCGLIAWNSGVHKDALDVRKLMLDVKEGISIDDARYGNPLTLQHPLIQDEVKHLREMHQDILDKHKTQPPNIDAGLKQLGNLGQGNHFWEVQEDSDGTVWIMIHSGSRNFGAQVAKKYIEKAQVMCRKFFTELPDKDLAFLPEDFAEGQAYIAEMELAQTFALYNRLLMLLVGQDAIQAQVRSTNPRKNYTNIHHNYTAKEQHFGENVWIHRKGATLARASTTGIIPGSMCSKSYIVKGKNNKDSFNSCSHGAGRLFSRTEAKKRITAGIDPPQIQQLGNVELYGVREAHDELGSAYKDIDTVMENQKDLVDIQVELKPIAVLKG